MKHRYFLIILFLLSPLAVAEPAQQMARIGDLKLVSGETLLDAGIGYRVAGTLNEDQSNVLVFLTWFTGSSGGLENAGLIGPGKLADTERYYVIAIDALGNGVSTSPSNSQRQPGGDFPAISIDDMVNSQHILLTSHLGIKHVKAVMGISMGGMQTFQWLGQYPDFMDRAVAIDGSPKLTSYDLVQWQTHATAIELMQQAGVASADIAKFLAQALLITLWTPQWFVENVSAEAFPAYLENAVKDYAALNASNYLVQLRAMMTHDVYADAARAGTTYPEQVKAKVLVAGVPQDHMVNPTPARSLAPEINAEYVSIDSNCGHLGSTCGAEELIPRVHAFLAD